MSQSVSDILKINKIKDLLSKYIKVKVELLKLDLTEHISNIIAQVIAYLIILLMSMFVLGFASLAVAHTINEYYGSRQLGYWVISGVYFVMLLVILFFLKSGKLGSLIESKISEAADTAHEQEGEEHE